MQRARKTRLAWMAIFAIAPLSSIKKIILINNLETDSIRSKSSSMGRSLGVAVALAVVACILSTESAYGELLGGIERPWPARTDVLLSLAATQELSVVDGKVNTIDPLPQLPIPTFGFSTLPVPLTLCDCHHLRTPSTPTMFLITLQITRMHDP